MVLGHDNRRTADEKRCLVANGHLRAAIRIYVILLPVCGWHPVVGVRIMRFWDYYSIRALLVVMHPEWHRNAGAGVVQEHC